MTPSLEHGQKFAYNIKATWTENGKPVVRERQVNFYAGDRLMVNMTAPPMNNAAAASNSAAPNNPATPKP